MNADPKEKNLRSSAFISVPKNGLPITNKVYCKIESTAAEVET